jgi:hypothetical protein
VADVGWFPGEISAGNHLSIVYYLLPPVRYSMPPSPARNACGRGSPAANPIKSPAATAASSPSPAHSRVPRPCKNQRAMKRKSFNHLQDVEPFVLVVVKVFDRRHHVGCKRRFVDAKLGQSSLVPERRRRPDPRRVQWMGAGFHEALNGCST